MPDTNNEHTPMPSTSCPLLGISSHQRRREPDPDPDPAPSSPSSSPSSSSPSTLGTVLRFLGGGIYTPDASTCAPIRELLNAAPGEEQDLLTERWRENKVGELGFVGVVSALLSGILTSTGSWPSILPNGQQSPWPVRTAWYTGIILSLFSLLSAADQTVRLHRLSAHRTGLAQIRALLRPRRRRRTRSNSMLRCDPRQHQSDGYGQDRSNPSTLQVMTWQLPVMFLTSATLCMMVGMFLHVWSATTHLRHLELWDDNTKVALTFSVVAVTCIVLFFVGQITLYTPAEEIESGGE